MKSLLLSMLLFCTGIYTSNAQIRKGTHILGGSVYFNSNKTNSGSGTDDMKYRNFSATPLYAKVTKDNFIVGGDLSYENTWQKSVNPFNSSSSELNNHNFGIGAFMRGYKTLGNSGFYLFLQSRIGFGILEGKTINKTFGGFPSSSEWKTSGFNVGLNLYPGISYAVTPKMHIETGLGNLFHAEYFNNSNTTSLPSPSGSKTKSSGFSAGVGLGSTSVWTVGIKFLMNSK